MAITKIKLDIIIGSLFLMGYVIKLHMTKSIVNKLLNLNMIFTMAKCILP